MHRSFLTKTAAEAWQTATERAILQARLSGRESGLTLADALAEYGATVTPGKKGARQEQRRIAALRRMPVAQWRVAGLTRALLRAHRDERAKVVSGSSVNRELALLGAVLKWARAELGVPVADDLLDGLKLPENPARTRRLQADEHAKIIEHAPAWLRPLVTLAVETALRRGELCALKWCDVDLERRVLTVREQKNGEAGAVIPLSSRATETLASLPRTGEDVVTVRPDSITQAFGTACSAAGIVGLRWHDLRGEAVSRLAERGLDINSIRAISRHKSGAILRYLRAGDASALAKRLG